MIHQRWGLIASEVFDTLNSFKVVYVGTNLNNRPLYITALPLYIMYSPLYKTAMPLYIMDCSQRPAELQCCRSYTIRRARAELSNGAIFAKKY